MISKSKTPTESPTVAHHRKTAAFGLLRRRTVFLPTWRAWLLMLVLAAAGVVAIALGVHRFLALTDPKPGGILVLEGWTSDYVVRQAAAEYDRGGYSGFYVTGGPIAKEAPLVEYADYATAGAASVKAQRPDLASVVVAVPGPDVRDDRTFHTARALRDRLAAEGKSPTRVNLVSFGTHARRSRYYFQKAFGDTVEVGVLAIQDESYDPKRWWTTSYGFRVVTSEMLAYVYTWFDGL